MNIPKEWKKKKVRQRDIKDVEISSIMTVPNTKDGELLTRLVQKEAQLCKLTGFRVKLVEGNGILLSRLFPSPLRAEGCPKFNMCLVCAQSDGKPSKCNVRNVVYTAECLECTENYNGTTGRSLYIGETSRSISERTTEHVMGCLRFDAGNFVIKHWLEKHRDREDPPRFRFKVNKVHRDALSRELDEAVKISAVSGRCNILNSKCEWNSNSLPRLVVEKSDLEKKKQASDLLKKEEQDELQVIDFVREKKKVFFQDAVDRIKNKDTAREGEISQVEISAASSTNFVSNQAYFSAQFVNVCCRSNKRTRTHSALLDTVPKKVRMERMVSSYLAGSTGMRLMIKGNGSSHKVWNDRLEKPTCFSQLTDGGKNAAEQKFAYKSERGLDGLLWQFRDCIDKQTGLNTCGERLL